MNSSNFLAPFFLILYLCIGFIPNWSAVDKIAPQWLGMNILNIIVICYLLYDYRSLKKIVFNFLKSKITLLYGFFILWAAGSFFYAINPTEQIVNITRQLNVFLMYGNMFILLGALKNKIRFLSWTILCIVSIEIYYVLQEALNMLNTNGVIAPGSLKGVTANRNITAFSLAIKLPFVYYLLHTQKKLVVKTALAVLIFSLFLGLSMIQSRASFLATGFSILAFIGGVVYFEFKEKTKSNKQLLLSTLGVLLPLLLTITINQTVLKDKGADAVSRAASIGAITTDDSITARLRYYSDVFKQFQSSPIFGVGLGNWKLKSIDFDKNDIKGYVVPYHAHSDFIQLGAELGIFGFLSYLGIFVLVIFFAFKEIFKNKNRPLEERLFIFLLIAALGIYSVDASLNFPIARPQVLVNWTLIIALVGFYNSHIKESNATKRFSKVYLALSLIFLIPSLYVSNSVYKSLKGQMFLLQDFNTNKYTVPLDQVDDIVPDIPNITVTTIPLKSVKARYYVNAKKYDKALSLLEQGTSANPYLFYSELLKSQIYSAKGQLDSAKHYAKKAFNGLPNNQLHAATYLNLISQTRDRKALEEAYELLTAKNDLNNWKNYLILAKDFFPPQDPQLIKRAKKAVTYFPENSEIKSLYNIIAIGNNNIAKSSEASARGLNFFNQKDFKSAAAEFEKAIESNPLDYAHYENAASANYMISNFEKALEQIDVVVNTMNPLNGKCEYIKALILLRLGDNREACSYLNTSLNSGYSASKAILEQNCK